MSPATKIAFSWKSGVFNQELMVPAHRVGWHHAAGILKLYFCLSILLQVCWVRRYCADKREERRIPPVVPPAAFVGAPPGECAAGAAARAPREAAVILGAGSFPPAPSAAANSLAL